MTMQPPTFADIEQAAARISSAIMATPCLLSETLSRITGCRLHLKFENLQFTASFKERGALNRLLLLEGNERRAGVCAMSAGNHAQGVAYHAARLGIPATIVMPSGTPLTKISRTREHGAKVIVAGANLSEALAIATDRAAADGLIFVHPYDDPAVIAGQGTTALEILAAVPDLDFLIVPVGGGGLLSGCAIAAKAIKPSIRLIGVQSAIYPSMARALAGDWDAVPDGLTIAEGIAVKTASRQTAAIIADHVDEILLVEEAAIERAIGLLLSVEKTVVEGAGAVGLAALLQYPGRFKGRSVGTLLSGGNIDLRVLASVAMRSLLRNGQILNFTAILPDRPGSMARFTATIGEAGANIVELVHDRMSLDLNLKGAGVKATAEVQDSAHGEMLLAALDAAGFAVSTC